MITANWIFVLIGLLFAAYAVLGLRDPTNPKRMGNAAFWGLMAVSMLAGGQIGDFGNGILVLALAGLATFGALGRGKQPEGEETRREALGERHGDWLFVPILIVLLTAIVGTLVYTYSPLHRTGLIEANRETFVFMALGVIIALGVCYAWLKPPVLAPVEEGRRLIDALGWATTLPMLLAALGAVLADAGVGRTIGGLMLTVIPEGAIFPAVLAFGLGMAVLTILTGNAFAAFPVMTTAIAVPLLIQTYDGDPAVIGAIGMLAGFCGTLMTPMAANFNLVPAALLELKDRNAVIKVQLGTAVPLLFVNILFIWWFGFR